MIGFLLLANFKPTTQQQPEPGILDTRRFQAVTSERESIILDTKTGQFVVMPSYLGQPRRLKYNFDDVELKGK
ncbi:hypothetical protein [Spirosoma sp. KNUC1025]|uniref:hypothetical protein n=1 Tax=Spirosoma sp. KNUC1025 TaxID=2894082 RepID=UPI003864E7EA|nr:hypothetical protein LN737_17365 [Spirosoma sp. KNUC1025]